MVCSTFVPVEAQTDEVAGVQARVNRVLEDAGRYFRDGLSSLKENRRQESGEKFNKSVEAFLVSSINIQRDERLQRCYSQLIETVYRLEYPSETQTPRFDDLAATCGWNWSTADFELANSVSSLLRARTKEKPALNVTALSAVTSSPLSAERWLQLARLRTFASGRIVETRAYARGNAA
ncbi:MAG: hypothetical protein C4325_06720 [Blastocatellia bacterium]